MNQLHIQNDVSLLQYNTFGIDAIAERFVELHSCNDYAELLMSNLLKGSSHFILGGGSNVILPDRYEGTIVHPANKGIRLVEQRDAHIYIEANAGEVWADFVDLCIQQGWYGLENLAAIPGCVGAAPVQNVGAYGKEAKDVIDRVHCFDICDGSERWIEASDCGFGYRWSNFKGEWKDRFIIDRVIFKLDLNFEPDITYKALSASLSERNILHPTARQLADTVATIRDTKLPNPKVTGSAGSFFKNPVVDDTLFRSLCSRYPDIVSFPTPDGQHKLAAGWMIEHCGWKGRTVGRVGVYEKQALVLVNRGKCSGNDVRQLAKAIIADVEEHFGVRLECEAIFV